MESTPCNSMKLSMEVLLPLQDVTRPNVMNLLQPGDAAIAQSIRLHLPSCHPGFESKAHHLCFYCQIWVFSAIINITKINKKRSGLAPIFKKPWYFAHEVNPVTAANTAFYFRHQLMILHFEKFDLPKSLVWLCREREGTYYWVKSRERGREPWSSGYGRRLTLKRFWVRIVAPDTGCTFYHIYCSKNCNVCCKRP